MVIDSRAFSGSLENLVLGVFQIVLIDLVLAGDNAVVIAMAVRSLPGQDQLKRSEIPQKRGPPVSLKMLWNQ